MQALKYNIKIFEFASHEFKKDKELVLEAAKFNIKILNHAPIEFLSDR